MLMPNKRGMQRTRDHVAVTGERHRRWVADFLRSATAFAAPVYSCRDRVLRAPWLFSGILSTQPPRLRTWWSLHTFSLCAIWMRLGSRNV